MTFITELGIATFISVGHGNKEKFGRDFNKNNFVGHFKGHNSKVITLGG